MILAVDVYYRENSARAAGVLFDDWRDDTAREVVLADISPVAAYEPGAFYKRELPCILEIVDKVKSVPLEAVVVDGYVYLDDARRPGLGKRLFDALNGTVSVVGVAKTAFRSNTANVVHAYRGVGKKPLYVSAVGMDADAAASRIQAMHGHYRIPDILKRLDAITRSDCISFAKSSPG